MLRLSEEQTEHVEAIAPIVRIAHGLRCPAGEAGFDVTACNCRLREVIPALCDAIATARLAGRTEQLTADDRRGLAAVFGYDTGRGDAASEAALELTNVRKLLLDLGVREADAQGVLRPTVAMLEDVLPRQ